MATVHVPVGERVLSRRLMAAADGDHRLCRVEWRISDRGWQRTGYMVASALYRAVCRRLRDEGRWDDDDLAEAEARADRAEAEEAARLEGRREALAGRAAVQALWVLLPEAIRPVIAAHALASPLAVPEGLARMVGAVPHRDLDARVFTRVYMAWTHQETVLLGARANASQRRVERVAARLGPQEMAFLAAIWEGGEPGDLARKVYADWLEERGLSYRASMVRGEVAS